MTPIWYEFDDDIYNLEKVCVFQKMRDGKTLRLFFGAGSDDCFVLNFKDQEALETEYDRIKTILDKIH